MSLKKGEIHNLTISNMAFGGKGIAKIDGFTIFVDKAVPLDIVNARIIKKKKKSCRGPCGKYNRAFPFQDKCTMQRQRFLRWMQMAVFKVS